MRSYFLNWSVKLKKLSADATRDSATLTPDAKREAVDHLVALAFAC
jgi:hypothetical protein